MRRARYIMNPSASWESSEINNDEELIVDMQDVYSPLEILKFANHAESFSAQNIKSVTLLHWPLQRNVNTIYYEHLLAQLRCYVNDVRLR